MEVVDLRVERRAPDDVLGIGPTHPMLSWRTDTDTRDWWQAASAVRARLHVSALGVYEVEINGTRVGDHVLAPGWTAYQHRVRVETFDVTSLVRPGSPNAFGAMLADGWFGERFGFDDHGRRIY